MTFDDWLQTVPVEITEDTLWKMQLYRQALFLGELGWHDAGKLMQDRRTLRLADQLYRATGKISTNIAEGYSKASGRDQARFYEYALGSCRETRDWYYKGRHVLGERVVQHRIRLTVHLIRQLLKMIPALRSNSLHEDQALYEVVSLETLLSQVPLT